jgi:ribosome-associated translation inhibitor RaiA
VTRRRKRSEGADFPLELSTRGSIGTADRHYASEKIARVGKLAPFPVLRARARLSEETNPSVERPAIVEASLDMGERVIRAHVAAAGMREAIDLLEERLRRRLDELNEHLLARRRETGVAEPGEWRHGDLPTARPGFFPRSVEERELLVHKTFGDGAESPEEAALDLSLLDYDFYLFTNAVSGEENVVFRRGDGRLGWAQQTPDADIGDEYVTGFEREPQPAPALTVQEAIGRLNAGGEPFVFFTNFESKRGNVLYRRYDGHYGLMTPPNEPSAW